MRNRGIALLLSTTGPAAVTRLIPTALLAAGALLGTGAEAFSQPREPPPRWKDPSRPTADLDVWLRRLVGRFRYEGTLNRPPDDKLVVVKGLGDCIAVGTSPGVHCMINLEWPEPWGTAMDPVWVANLDPAMILYGVEPNVPGMRYLQVNQKGLAEGGQGSIAGDTATFRAPCVNTGSVLSAGRVPRGAESPTAGGASVPSPTAETGLTGAQGASIPDYSFDSGSIDPDSIRACQRVTRIEARPDSQIIWIRIDIGDPMQPFWSFVLSLYSVPQTDAGESPPTEGAR